MENNTQSNAHSSGVDNEAFESPEENGVVNRNGGRRVFSPAAVRNVEARIRLVTVTTDLDDNGRVSIADPNSTGKKDSVVTFENDKNNQKSSNKVEKDAKDDEDDDDDEEEEEDDENANKSTNFLTRFIYNARTSLYKLIENHKKKFEMLVIFTIFALYNAYLIGAIVHNVNKEIRVAWCDGLGFLIILTGITYWSFFYYFVLKRFLGKWWMENVVSSIERVSKNGIISNGLLLVVVIGLVTFIVIDCWDDKQRLVSAAGVVIIVLIGMLFSKYPHRIQWSQVIWGIIFQFAFGLAVLRWEGGRSALDCLSQKVTTFLDFANDGSTFIYSYLSSGNASATINLNLTSGELYPATILLPTIFAFKALSVIYFFSFVIGILYHFGAMTWVVMKVGWVLQITVGTTAAESMNAAANIFLGQTEAPILVKPFLPKMTKSELHAVMTGGFATIAGSVMAAYISFGIEPAYLLSASVMAAPAALSFSKLMYPETKKSKTTAEAIQNISTKTEGNALDAAAQAAIQGVILIGCIVANLIAFISFVAFLNAIVGWLGSLVGLEELTFEEILAKIFIPVAYIIGIKGEDTEKVARLLGLKTVVNEFVAYERMINMGDEISKRSQAIATYALCSFANISSIGIQLGGLSTLAPTRRKAFAKIVVRALFAGSCVGLLNACMAGMLLSV